MDDLGQLGELARAKVLVPRPAPSARETRRANRALWAIGFGVVAAALGVFCLSLSSEPSGGAAGSGAMVPPLRATIWGLSLALLDVITGLGAVALGLSAVHAEHERYSGTALIAVVLGSLGWLGLILLLLS